MTIQILIMITYYHYFKTLRFSKVINLLISCGLTIISYFINACSLKLIAPKKLMNA